MKHVGDITKLNGAELPLVDIITGGSPCQDLSVAGKRAGLAGERSGLFMEQIRIIKEMRNESIRQIRMRGADVDNRLVKPRYMVWENVPGAFSSNHGEDFRAVLEETARVADQTAVIPGPPKNGWSTSGAIMGDGWSIAWRVHDAQFWGVPQRRKRIALVADFGGETAPEILFERESMSGNTAQSGDAGKTVTEATRDSAKETSEVTATITATYGTKWNGNAGAYNGENFVIERNDVSISFQERGGKPGGGVKEYLSNESEPEHCQHSITNPSSKCLNSWDVQSKHIQPENGKAEALYSGECRYGGESYAMQGFDAYNQQSTGDKAMTLRAERTDQEHIHCVYGISSFDSNAMKSPNPNSGIYEADTSRTLDVQGGNPACNQGGMIVLEGNGARPSHQGDGYSESEVSYTLNAVEKHGVCTYQDVTGTLNPGGHPGSYNGQDAYNDMLVIDKTIGVDCHNATVNEDKTNTMLAGNNDNHNVPGVCYGLDRASFNQGQNAQYDFSVQEEVAQTIVARGPGGVLTQ